MVEKVLTPSRDLLPIEMPLEARAGKTPQTPDLLCRQKPLLEHVDHLARATFDHPPDGLRASYEVISQIDGGGGRQVLFTFAHHFAPYSYKGQYPLLAQKNSNPHQPRQVYDKNTIGYRSPIGALE